MHAGLCLLAVRTVMVGIDFSGVKHRKTDDFSGVLWFNRLREFIICEICTNV